VKAKSYNSSDPKIVGANVDLLSGMRPYIEDVAFQAHVMRSALQTLPVNCRLDPLQSLLYALCWQT
jgi:hypothetical protein